MSFLSFIFLPKQHRNYNCGRLECRPQGNVLYWLREHTPTNSNIPRTANRPQVVRRNDNLTLLERLRLEWKIAKRKLLMKQIGV
jgi:hypothetical protein